MGATELIVLAQQVFEGGAEVGFFVAVFHDDGSVERLRPQHLRWRGPCLMTAREPGTTTALLGDDEGHFGGGADGGAVDEIEDGRAAGEDGAGSEDGAGADDGAFVDAAVAADQDVVFDDDGAGVDGLEDAADLGGGAEMDALADLGAGADEGVGVDHGAFVDPCAGVDVAGGTQTTPRAM